MRHLRPSLCLLPIQEQCLYCRNTAPLPDNDLCASCFQASQYVRPIGQMNVCPVCLEYDDLHTSDLYDRDLLWCRQHAVLATVRKNAQPDYVHIGDIRNIA